MTATTDPRPVPAGWATVTASAPGEVTAALRDAEAARLAADEAADRLRAIRAEADAADAAARTAARDGADPSPHITRAAQLVAAERRKAAQAATDARASATRRAVKASDDAARPWCLDLGDRLAAGLDEVGDALDALAATVDRLADVGRAAAWAATARAGQLPSASGPLGDPLGAAAMLADARAWLARTRRGAVVAALAEGASVGRVRPPGAQEAANLEAAFRADDRRDRMAGLYVE